MIQKMTGHSFRPTKNDKVQLGTVVKLYHEQGNQYSAKAIAISYKGELLGYIAEKNNPAHEKIFEVLPIEAKVVSIARLQEGEKLGNFTLGDITQMSVEFDMPSDNQDKVKSFNEDVFITFLPVQHKYVYEGQELVSATRYIKKWIQEFDKERVSGFCAESYGTTQQKVLDYWASAGRISANFGTAIHDALEHYEKYKDLGEVIGNKKETENNALPSHPYLRQVVTDFYKQDLHEGIVHPEALVSNVELGFCGFVDRLLQTGTKACRVQDYKININSDVEDKNTKYLGQFAELPKNKISKYQLQLSFYARLLELSGWTVEGLDVYVYEDEWKHYEIEKLKLDF